MERSTRALRSTPRTQIQLPEWAQVVPVRIQQCVMGTDVAGSGIEGSEPGRRSWTMTGRYLGTHYNIGGNYRLPPRRRPPTYRRRGYQPSTHIMTAKGIQPECWRNTANSYGGSQR
ncbi:hypothetical protein NDU88_000958 [Pleurodeles waltl]|uniref:Uncharacterized protein n=1 Tax=Pleurodeles waltl TaxID=8319 RepID=A0AAV7SY68_PLEWA|nr:hypothetical protein NDU88_000958 [Pleurodeles waltl]